MADKCFLVVSPGVAKEDLETKFTGSCVEILDKESSGVSVWVIRDIGDDDKDGIVVEIDSETDMMGWVISSAWAKARKWMEHK